MLPRMLQAMAEVTDQFLQDVPHAEEHIKEHLARSMCDELMKTIQLTSFVNPMTQMTTVTCSAFVMTRDMLKDVIHQAVNRALVGAPPINF